MLHLHILQTLLLFPQPACAFLPHPPLPNTSWSPCSHLLLPFPDPSIHPSACWHCHLRVLIPTGPQRGADESRSLQQTLILQQISPGPCRLLGCCSGASHLTGMRWQLATHGSANQKKKKKCKTAAWNQPASSLLLLVNHFFLFPLFFVCLFFVVCVFFFLPPQPLSRYIWVFSDCKHLRVSFLPSQSFEAPFYDTGVKFSGKSQGAADLNTIYWGKALLLA